MINHSYRSVRCIFQFCLLKILRKNEYSLKLGTQHLKCVCACAWLRGNIDPNNTLLLWMPKHFFSFHHLLVTDASWRTRVAQHCRLSGGISSDIDRKMQMKCCRPAVLLKGHQCFICTQDGSHLHPNKMQEQMSGEDGKRLCKNDFTSNLRNLLWCVSWRPKCVISVPLNWIMMIMFPKHA